MTVTTIVIITLAITPLIIITAAIIILITIAMTAIPMHQTNPPSPLRHLLL